MDRRDDKKGGAGTNPAPPAFLQHTRNAAMKSRSLWNAMIGPLLFALGIGLYMLLADYAGSAVPLDARVDRDCAPADGPAFTLTIPVEGAPGSMIVISIWHAPDFLLPMAFSVPDETGGTGNAVYRPASGPDEPLSGRVSFRQVKLGEPVVGQFNLTSEGGEIFNGRFRAVWGMTTIPCG
jgi:hypothetical protein